MLTKLIGAVWSGGWNLVFEIVKRLLSLVVTVDPTQNQNCNDSVAESDKEEKEESFLKKLEDDLLDYQSADDPDYSSPSDDLQSETTTSATTSAETSTSDETEIKDLHEDAAENLSPKVNGTPRGQSQNEVEQIPEPEIKDKKADKKSTEEAFSPTAVAAASKAKRKKDKKKPVEIVASSEMPAPPNNTPSSPTTGSDKGSPQFPFEEKKKSKFGKLLKK